MQINWLRFALTAIATFMAYGIVYEGGMAITGLGALRGDFMRAPDDPLVLWMWVGHGIETLVIVFLFHTFVRTRDIKTGALYGAAIGLYYTATQLSSMGAMASFPAALAFDLIGLHMLAGIIAAGIVPTLLYAPPVERSTHPQAAPTDP